MTAGDTGAELAAALWEGRDADHWRREWCVPAVHLYLRCASTNDIARRLAEAGAPHGTLVIAEEQSAGRGREGRRWQAPPGLALLCSLVLRLEPGTANAPGAAPLRVGLAVAGALEALAPADARVKWPNDVVDDRGRKLAGILCEGAVSDAGGFLVAGIGVNANQTPDDWPAELRGRAASVRMLAGRPVSRAELLHGILGAVRPAGAPAAGIARRLDAAELDELRRRDPLRGRNIEVDGVPAGTALGIDADGALRVRRPDGAERRVLGGSVRIAAEDRHHRTGGEG